MSAPSKRSQRSRKSQERNAKPKESPFFRPLSGLTVQVPRDPSPPTNPRPIRNPTTEPDDASVFERFVAGVQPLDPAKTKRISKSQAEVDSTFAERAKAFALECELADREALHKLHALVHDGSRFEIMDDGHRIEGRRRGADGGLIRRMRDGDIPVDATLDLVGMRLEQARNAIEDFVRDCRMRGDRVVLLQYGRRWEPSEREAILRGEVAAWLSGGAACTHVAAFVTAPPALGGERAVCVLLAQPSETYNGMG